MKLSFLCSLIMKSFILLVFFVSSCSTEDIRPRVEAEESASLKTKVKTRLLTDKKVNGLTIDVGSNKETIRLTGRVSSLSEKRRAGLLASQIKGVREVVNELEIAAE